MAVGKQQGDLDHIEVRREPEREPERRRRPGYGSPPPRPASRVEHGSQVLEETTDATASIVETREAVGVDPGMLLVLEFDSVNVDLRDHLEQRFDAWIVDEQVKREDDQQQYRYVVQFRDREALNKFQTEIGHYQQENPQTIALPLGARRNFFDALQHVRPVSMEERRGGRLSREGFPDSEQFYLDVDLWHPGDQAGAQTLRQQIRTLCHEHGGQWRDTVHTASLLLGKVRAGRELAEILLGLDFVARVDLSPQISEAYSGIFRDPSPPDPGIAPDATDGLACVVDSGVVAGHPMLRNWVIDERDFDSGELSVTDQNGHGTSVAGLVVYGDVAECIAANRWRPRVRICSAKVLRHDPTLGHVVFPEENRVEEVVENAIRHFVRERSCRVFNLSVGDAHSIYSGGRQFPLAEKLDELARELNVVIVVSAGNRSDPPIPRAVRTREQLQGAVRAQLLADPAQRVCNPATAALAVTVGAIARSDAVDPARPVLPVAPVNAPAPFTRTGPGYEVSETASGIKPDFIAYGGNYGLQTLAGAEARWVTNLVFLGEPTIRPERGGRILTAQTGTSFAAPHVTHAAAIVEQSLRQVLGRGPSANLIRAMLGSAATSPGCPEGWLGSEDEQLRFVGFGQVDMGRLIWSRQHDVCLVAEDTLEEDRLHLYKIGVPSEFLAQKGRRGIVGALAFDPPVRANRKEYLSRTMRIELLHGLTDDEVEVYRARYQAPNPPSLPAKNDLSPDPPRTKLEKSTLQVRSISWTRRPQLKVPSDGPDPVIHVLVTCQRRFASGADLRQRYGLVVRFWHENPVVQLHQRLTTRVRAVARVRV